MHQECRVEIEFKSVCNIGYDDENYIQKIHGKVLARAHNEDREFDIEIGNIELCYIDTKSAIGGGNSLFALFDSDAFLGEYCEFLYDISTGEWDSKVLKMFDDQVFNSNVLILHRLMILPRHRGKRIGLFVLGRCIQQFSHGCGIVTLNAKPYQIEVKEKQFADEIQKFGLDSFEQNKAKAYKKLENYYQNLGFRKLRGTKLMVLNPDFRMISMSKLGADEHGYFDIDFGTSVTSG